MDYIRINKVPLPGYDAPASDDADALREIRFMKIDIRTRGFALTDAIRDHVERRLRFALARADAYVRQVTVHLADIEGSRGGIEKRCRVRVRLKPGVDLLVEDTEAELYAAVDRAADRVGRSVVRRVTSRGSAAADSTTGT